MNKVTDFMAISTEIPTPISVLDQKNRFLNRKIRYKVENSNGLYPIQVNTRRKNLKANTQKKIECLMERKREKSRRHRQIA